MAFHDPRNSNGHQVEVDALLPLNATMQDHNFTEKIIISKTPLKRLVRDSRHREILILRLNEQK